MSFYEAYLAGLKQDYPSLCKNYDAASLVNPNLISSQKLSLSRVTIDKIKAFVEAIYALRDEASYQQRILKTHELFRSFSPPKNYSSLMSFDFHIVDEINPKLIEINTNASSSLVIDESYRVNHIKNIFEENFRADIVRCFETEFALGFKDRKLQTIAIVDEKPEKQKMYVEFLMFQELFTKAGYQCLICGPEELSIKDNRLMHGDIAIDLVYNRHTDFYLSNEVSKAMREAYLKSYACFTPHPFEYALLADKQRLFEISTEPDITTGLTNAQKQIIADVVLKSYDVATTEDKDWFWKNKRSLFFKPKRSFGGKATYRGQGVTKGVFEEIKAAEYLAQEFAPPPEVEVKLENGTPETFKCDLRFYVYQGRVQQGVARLWKGQMTNISSLGGGLTPILLK